MARRTFHSLLADYGALAFQARNGRNIQYAEDNSSNGHAGIGRTGHGR